MKKMFALNTFTVEILSDGPISSADLEPIAQFIEAGLLSRLHVAVSPLLIGAGPQGLTIQPVTKLSQARRPETQIYGLGSDVLFDCLMGARAQARIWPHAEQAAVWQG